MNKLAAFLVMLFAAVCDAEAFSVSDVSATPRLPWKSVLDVDFTIEGAQAGDLYKVEVVARHSNGQKKIFAKSYLNEPLFGPGANRITWDVGADYPELNAGDLQVAVTATKLNVDALDVYMVIDLSSGPTSRKYPVSYTFAPPVLVPTNDYVACAGDPNRTTKLWLKRIRENEFPFGATGTSPSGDFNVKLTPYYIGVFEVTQKQWALVMDAWPSQFTNELYRGARPVSNIDYNDVIGHERWPENKNISEESFVGKVRARTGLATFNLPTEAQWEGACRAGVWQSTVSISRSTGRCKDHLPTHTYTYNESPDLGTALVGSFSPNGWGLYDVLGNVMEMCLDAHADTDDLKDLYKNENPVVDPIGPAEVNSTQKYHATRGGSYINSAGFCAAHRRDYNNRTDSGSVTTGKKLRYIGFRAAVSPDWK